ncbi:MULTISPECIES: phosphopyruvate hydratase [Halobacterium]|uniref:phosphopyruvate hydratase n=1 Tax=Halobacterium TaxID=2239 RepID=UPI001963E9CA|nr:MULTISPECIES: phosphopyruvate hydratase [Halobacterium]MCF2208254.1 enolase [Halobacterium salinarum]MDL0122615.1 enolase [Halobacterium salinarum]MDL0124631.1 enolase [Halobacterium salinarum]MDL0128027.1 enolase [Halobacterium salinarum]MDL0136403.1 enolase [Halobacterium salinarum]
MTRIEAVRYRPILDSRGNKTVEAEVTTDDGGFGRAAAPSGASTGEHEAVELPVGEAIAAGRERIAPRLEGREFAGDQRGVDAALHAADDTTDFSAVGANVAVATSMAAAKAAADVLGVHTYQHLGGALRGRNFPVPLGNVLGGGAHAADATAIQEFLVAATGAPSVRQAVFANAAVHQRVKDRLDADGVPAAKGDEGAWAPSIDDATAFDVVAGAAAEVADEFGFDVRLGLDLAAAERYDGDEYVFGDDRRSTAAQIEYVAGLVSEYDLAYVEDPLDENDFEAFAELTDRVGDETLVCGDDLFVTNTERLQRGIDAGAANSILVKPNQIGTLTDAVDAIELATRNGYDAVVSHRSGETEDTTIAHLAVATDAPFIKTGAVGGERTAKLNELIRIADEA